MMNRSPRVIDEVPRSRRLSDVFYESHVLNRNVAILITLSLAVSVSAVAQQRPNFSGEWTRVDQADRPSIAASGDAAFPSGSMGSGWGSPLTIRQDSNRLIIEYPVFSAYDLQPPLRFVYALDGSESRNSVMISHTTSQLRSRVLWRDSTLIITTIYPTPELSAGSTPAEVRQALTLESANTLVLETTRSGASGAAANVIRTVFTKGAPR